VNQRHAEGWGGGGGERAKEEKTERNREKKEIFRNGEYFMERERYYFRDVLSHLDKTFRGVFEIDA